MLPESVKTVRIKFIKVGSLKFISHLDLCRTFKTAMVRAKIPLWYTCGFNPHPKMVFALTVSVGSESMCEYLDVRIEGDMEPAEIKARLIDALTGELRIQDVYYPERKFAEIAYAKYKIRFNDIPDVIDIDCALAHPMVVKKHTKSGEKEVDIRPAIIECSAKKECGSVTVDAILCAAADNYLNPDYLAKAVGSQDYDVMRTDILLPDRTSFK